MLDDRRLDGPARDRGGLRLHPGAGRLARRWSSGTTSASRRPPSATTWPPSRRRATSPSRTPAPGRVPTDKGYRLFVDRLVGGQAAVGRRAARRSRRFLDGAVDLDDVVARTVRLLAQLTRQVAVVQYPSLTRSRSATSRWSGCAATRLMLVLITDTGRVEQRVVELPGAGRRGRRRRAAG